MKIIVAFPPNFEAIKAAIKIDDWDKWVKEKGTVFTYGDTIFNPSNAKIPDHLLIHESIHEKQQGKDPEGWWKDYLALPEFRFEQEAEAYSEQYKFISAQPNLPARIKKAFLTNIVMDLISAQYGLSKNYGEVESLIRQRAKV